MALKKQEVEKKTEQNGLKGNVQVASEKLPLPVEGDHREGKRAIIATLNPIQLVDNPNMKKALRIALLLWTLPMLAQSNTGELRLTVTDPSGSGLKSTVELVSEANQYSYTYTTDDHGSLDAKRLPYGVYQIQIDAPAFARLSQQVEIRSALPLDRAIQLKVASASET